jgi:hypothetical protein
VVKFEGDCVFGVQELIPNAPGHEARGKRCMAHECSEYQARRSIRREEQVTQQFPTRGKAKQGKQGVRRWLPTRDKAKAG